MEDVMRHPTKKLLLAAMVALAAAAVLALPTAAFAATAPAKPEAPKAFYAGRVDSHTLELTWKKQANVSGYAVYRADPGKAAFKKVATVAKNKVHWVDRHTKANATYRYQMRSYKLVGGKKAYSAYTYTASSKTHSPNAKKTNVLKVAAPKKLTIGVMEAKAIGAKAQASKFTAYKKPAPISTKLYYSSSNGHVKVSASGKLTGASPGTATVTVRSHNGRTAKVKVTVKDYSHPADIDLTLIDSGVAAAFKAHDKDIYDIAHYFLTHPQAGTGFISIDSNENITVQYGVKMGDIEPAVQRLLIDCPYWV
jgi:hypothetical protein